MACARQTYVQTLDLILQAIKSRFDHKGTAVYADIEKLLTGEWGVEQIHNISSVYGLCSIQLESEICVVRKDLALFSSNIFDFISNFKVDFVANKGLYPLVHQLLILLLLLPATNASSDKSVSALKRLRTALRNSTAHQEVSSLLLMHVHKEETDALSLQEVIKDFVSASDTREHTIAVLD